MTERTEKWYHSPERRCVGREQMFIPPDVEAGSGHQGWSSVPARRRCTIGGGCPVLWECLDSAIDEGDALTVRGGLIGAPIQRVIDALRLESAGRGAGDAAELMADLEARLVKAGARPRVKPWSPRRSLVAGRT